jgi:uncharacterized protein (TIRG00374 family)
MVTERVKRAAWFAVSTFIVVLMVWFADFSRVVEVFRKAQIVYFLPALVFGLSTFLVFAFTWHRCFEMVGQRQKYRRSLQLYIAGEFLNSVTPVGQLGGEPFMAYVVRENSDMKYEEAFSTVLSADIINSIPMLTFVLGAFIYMIFLGPVESVLQRTLGIVVMAAVIGSALAYIIWFKTQTMERHVVDMFERFTRLIGRGEGHLEKVEERMAGVRKTLESIGADPRRLVEAAAVAHFFLVFAVASLHFVMRSLGVETGIASLVFVVVFSGVSNFMPTPGGSGAFEFAMASLLTVFVEVNFAVATTAAILYRAASYWPAMAIGYLSLLSLGGRD